MLFVKQLKFNLTTYKINMKPQLIILMQQMPIRNVIMTVRYLGLI